ncbi:immunoglobulin kappa light chain-like [Clarias gariepinus]|uniref:immunoglobulin kappa light chain-like n=1 Tax=Clarias gariepinus TaxID=13013 RepID=UPI00234E1739|nr:immunoglobulin kappa light chain-like [Clarias gariepinus]
MVQVKALPVFLCVMGFLSETLCSLTLEAEVGDKVTIWCQHDLSVTGFISWYKHTRDSAPLLLGCKKIITSAQLVACHFFTESERIVMSVHEKNTSLTITAVNVSDTGLYYCSYIDLNQVKFSNPTSLNVKEGNIKFSEGKQTGCVCSAVSLLLTAGFGLATVIIFCVLIFIILKHRKVNTG